MSIPNTNDYSEILATIQSHASLRNSMQIKSIGEIYYPVEEHIDEFAVNLSQDTMVTKVNAFFQSYKPNSDMSNLISLMNDPKTQDEVYKQFLITMFFMIHSVYKKRIVGNSPSSYSIKHSVENWIRGDKHNKKYLHHITDTMVEIVALLLGKDLKSVYKTTFIPLDKKRSPVYNVPVMP